MYRRMMGEQIKTGHFANITAADFIARTAYQMGKTPLLPLFATTLGAGSAFLGLIVSVSTLTGMCLKPLIGALSDRWGRRAWLLAGTLLFAGTPFLYRFVHTPEQLLVLRLFHGLATAIYGPVTLAFVAERASQDKAEKLGWFGMARSGGYIVGPAAAGWLLTYLEPVTVFTIIGLLSCLAFIPIVLLEDLKTSAAIPYPSVGRQVAAGLKFGALAPSLWLAGSLEATVFIALYSVKAFLPIFALNQGMSVALVGTFFSIQEAIYLVLRPVGGRLGDRLGYQTAIALGMGLIALCLSLLPWAHSPLALLVLAGCIGAGQSLIFPSTIALVASRVDPSHTGASMGLIGTLKNAGKVAGPLLGGLLIHWLDYTWMFWAMTALLVIGAATLWYRTPEAENERRVTL
jgi:MFS family permease